MKISSSPAEHVAPRYPSSSATSSSSSSSSSSNTGVVGFDPKHPPLPPARPGELRECYYNLAERGTCNLLATNTSQQECCCTVGEAWGLGCQYHTCPSPDTGESTHCWFTDIQPFDPTQGSQVSGVLMRVGSPVTWRNEQPFTPST